MKFFMYSREGDGAHILKRIENEGNECSLFIQDSSYKDIFEGMINKVDSISGIDRDTIIIFDSIKNGELADDMKRSGYKVFGGGKFNDKLEMNREYGIEVMRQCGIKTPKYMSFEKNEFNKAKRYIIDNKKALVFKPNGVQAKLTYVAKTTEEMIRYVEFIEEKYSKEVKSFIIQEYIEGLVISSEYFCAGHNGFIDPGNHTVEVKKFMNDDLGPSSGCSGNITWPCVRDKIFEQGVLKVEEICKREGLIGQIDLNAVVNESGVYGLEFTCRFGYDATPTLLTLLGIDVGKFIFDIVDGNSNLGDIEIDEEYAGSVRITVPPYPIETKLTKKLEEVSPSKGIPIMNWEHYEDNIYFYEVMKSKDKDSLVHSSGSGIICLGIGTGINAESCMRVPYEIGEEIIIPDKQYRTDLGEVLPGMVKESEQYA